MKALLDECREGAPPPEEAIKQICDIGRQAEPVVQPYLRECFLCFIAGAYGAAIVACWCAIARYLRLVVVEAMGTEIADVYYIDEENHKQRFEEAIKHSDKPLYIVYNRMKLVEDGFKDNVTRLKDQWEQRCRYAHPHDGKASFQEAFDYFTQASWLLIRKVNDERFHELGVFLECAEDKELEITKDVASKLVFRVSKDKSEKLANVLLSNMISISKKGGMTSERAQLLWDEVKPRLSKQSRGRLMRNLAQVLKTLSKPGQTIQVTAENIASDIVFWENVTTKAEYIWEYMVERRLYLSEYTKRIVRSTAPEPYKTQIDEPS